MCTTGPILLDSVCQLCLRSSVCDPLVISLNSILSIQAYTKCQTYALPVTLSSTPRGIIVEMQKLTPGKLADKYSDLPHQIVATNSRGCTNS